MGCVAEGLWKRRELIGLSSVMTMIRRSQHVRPRILDPRMRRIGDIANPHIVTNASIFEDGSGMDAMTASGDDATEPKLSLHIV